MPVGPKPLVIATGPTAVGKTEICIEMAAHLGAEIVSADSRQVFRELSIGTAKPLPHLLARVPHHFVDDRSITEPWSAGIFQREAEKRIREIASRDRAVLVTGGSTLYLHALLRGLDDIPDVPSEVRSSVEQRLAEEGAENLFAYLKRVDPDAASTMDPTKTQRLIRAVEVYEATGTPLSSFHAEAGKQAHRFGLAVLTRPRAELYDRIDRRVDEMMAAGLVEEVRRVLDAGHSPRLNPLQTIGYQEVIAYLRRETDLTEMVRLIKRNTRRYAKRQVTWFRRYDEAKWIDVSLFSSPAEAAGSVLDALVNRLP